VTPDGNSLAMGTNQTFTATGIFANGTSSALSNVNVTWTTSSNTTASVSASGVATANAPGAAIITATSQGVSGSAGLFVASKTLASVSLTPANASISAGTTQQFHFVGTFSDGSTQDLTSSATWSSGTAATANVTSLGLATGLAVGTSSIGATFQGFSASSTLTVTTATAAANATLVAIQVTPNGSVLAVNTTQQFTATGIFSNGSSSALSNVTWSSSSNTSTINATTGSAKAIAAGEATITATAQGVSGSGALFVGAKALASVSLTPANATIAAGTTQQFRLVGTFTDATTQDLTSSATWTSGTPATGVVSSLGLATGLAAGTSSIGATFQGFSGTSSLTVTAAKLVSIAITSAGAPSIANGTTVQLGATGTFSDATTQNITSTVTWASTNAGQASVSNVGLATGVAPGTVSITATSSGVSASYSLTVNPVTIVKVVVSPGNTTVPLGSTTQLRAVGFFSDNSTQDLTTQSTWASSANATANVSNAAATPNTASTQGLVTPVAVGIANITATFVGPNNSANGTSVVNVTPATLVSLSITPAANQVELGGTVNFTLSGVFTDKSTQVLNSAPFPVNGSYLPSTLLPGTQTPVSANAFFSATPNVTLPGGNAASPINAVNGTFTTNVTGTFNVTATLNNSTITQANGTVVPSPLNGTSVSTNITIFQPPASGPLLFTGYTSGNISANPINPTTGALYASIGGYPYAVANSLGQANPVWSILTNPEQSDIYVSQFAPYVNGPNNGTAAVANVTSLVVSQSGSISANASAPFAPVNPLTLPPSPLLGFFGPTTGDFGIIANLVGVVFPEGYPGDVTTTPFFNDGTINTNGALSAVTPLGSNINALACSGNYLFSTDGTNVYSYSVTTNGVFGPISTVIDPGLTQLTTDPNGSILVGINSTVGANPSLNTLSVFKIGEFGNITSVQQAVTHLASPPTKVRTNGNLIFVLSQGSTAFETFYFNVDGPNTLNSLGLQFSGNSPVDVDFDPTNLFVYVANSGDGTVSAFAINNVTAPYANVTNAVPGASTLYGEVSGSPFAVNSTGSGPITSLRVFR
jgi:hypothetical protein